MIDQAGRDVRLDGEPVGLTRSEFDLLAALATTPGRVFSRYELVARVHGYDYEGYERTADVHVKNLRAKLGDGLSLSRGSGTSSGRGPMNSRSAPGGGRVPLARSFAFRLGAAFAVVAIASAAITALVVNAAFAARFDRFLAQQQHAQVTRITMAAGRAYAGSGKWDLHALQTLVPAAGSGTLRIITPSGKDVWQWDGHSMSWNNQWMQSPPAKGSHHGSGHDSTGKGSSQGSTGHGGCGSWDNCGSWSSGSWNMGWTEGTQGRAASQAALLAAAATPAASPAASSAGLGTVQRIPVKVNGKVVGTALVRVPQATALPDAVAFRGEVIALVLAAGAAGALVSLGLGIFFARRATRPVRDITSTAQAVAAGDRQARLDATRVDEFGQMS